MPADSGDERECFIIATTKSQRFYINTATYYHVAAIPFCRFYIPLPDATRASIDDEKCLFDFFALRPQRFSLNRSMQCRLSIIVDFGTFLRKSTAPATSRHGRKLFIYRRFRRRATY